MKLKDVILHVIFVNEDTPSIYLDDIDAFYIEYFRNCCRLFVTDKQGNRYIYNDVLFIESNGWC